MVKATILVDPVQIHHGSWRLARAGLGLVGRSLLAGWRRRLLSSAVDATAASARRSCVVVATHPGDETLGAGATIARKRGVGTPVHVVVVTDGRHASPSRYLRPRDLAARRDLETRRACAMLGVDADSIEMLGFEEGTLGRCGEAVAGALVDRLACLNADEVLVPWALELDADRRAVHDVTCEAVSRLGTATAVACYPVDLWVHGPFARTPGTRLGGWQGLAGDLQRLRPQRPAELVRSGDYVYLKQAALACYTSLVTNLTGEVGWRSITTEAARRVSSEAEVFFRLVPTTRRAAGTPTAPPAYAQPGNGSDEPDRRLEPEVIDRFDDEQPRGTVVGTTTVGGVRRGGVDLEGTIAVQDGRLRFDPLATPGWGRQGVSYGPFARRAGLALAARVLHSHGNAHTDHRGVRRTWLLGQLARRPFFGQLLPVPMQDSLTVGFHADEAPADPRAGGAAFVIHAAGALNAELRALVAGGQAELHEGVQDVPFTYVVVMRSHGAVYYTSGLPGAAGAVPHPWMRPLAIDPTAGDGVVHAGVHQAMHGEADYAMASAIEALAVRDVPALADWCTSAVGADRLRGPGQPLGASEAQRGGPWRVLEGSPVRSPRGLRCHDGVAALLDLGEPAGLVHVVLETDALLGGSEQAGLVWRSDPTAEVGWRVLVANDWAQLSVAVDGRWSTVAEGPSRLPAAHRASLQVLDDGAAMTVHLDGRPLFGGPVCDARHAHGSHAGVVGGPSPGLTLSDFEAHPRRVVIPAELDLGEPWHRRGRAVVVCDAFEGPQVELAAADRSRAPAWVRSVGRGHFDLTGDRSLRVRADRRTPNPDRTIYTVGWSDARFADLQVDVLPPGIARSQGHGSRGGLVFWQDESTYLVLNLWIDDSPTHDGSALSFFYRCQGYERRTDAAWSNIGRRATWGRRCRLRASCDGGRVLVWVDGEPVLQRHLRDVYPCTPPLAIRRVGLVANEEWGHDTGTTFFDFVARADR